MIRKVTERSASIKFGRWLLKHAEPIWDSGFLCWMYDGKNLNTDELYELFLKEPLGAV